MENTTTVRITKAQKFACINTALEELLMHNPDFHCEFPGVGDKDGVNITVHDLMEFCNAEVALLARKNSSDPSKQTDAQKENEKYKAEILEFLATLPAYDPNDTDAKKGYTATEILKGTSIGEKFQLPKVTSLLTQLGKGTANRPGSNQVERLQGQKGVAVFRLA